MSDGIYDKMEESKKKRKLFWMWFTLGGSAILLAVLFFLFLFSNETKKNQISTPNTSTEIAETKKEVNPIISDKTLIDQKEQNSTQIVSQNNISSSQTQHKTSKQFQETTVSTSSIKKLETDKPNFSDKTPEFSTPISKQKTTVFVPKMPSKLLTNPNTKLEGNSDPTKQPITISKQLVLLPIHKIELATKPRLAPQINHAQKITNETKDEPKNDQPTTQNKIKFAHKILPHIYGGTLLTSGKYNGFQQRNQYSNWLPGYYAGLEFTVLEYKKWKLNLGYEHKFSVQLFDFQNITDTIANVLVEDVVTGITTNSLDGTTTEHTEDISTRAVRNRNFLHYNTFRSHAFRFTVVRSFKFSKNWQLMAGLGGSYNFVNLTKGRTIGIDRNTLDYDKNNPIYLEQNWGLEGGFSLAYQIGKVSLRGNLWVEKALSYSNEPDTEIRPVFYKIGLGISRRL